MLACSAGGLATYLHVDEWCDGIKQLSYSSTFDPSSDHHQKPWEPRSYLRASREYAAVTCVGLPDSGFFLDYQASEEALNAQTTPPIVCDVCCVYYYTMFDLAYTCLLALVGIALT